MRERCKSFPFAVRLLGDLHGIDTSPLLWAVPTAGRVRAVRAREREEVAE
ncbi:MAG: hypothetical protein NZ696_02580 [Thermomicrobium sp.]|nr:hypothetical protein [Thermomicrobium sp.]